MRKILALPGLVLVIGHAEMPHPLDCAIGVTRCQGYRDLDPATAGWKKQPPEQASVTPAADVR